MLAVNLSKELGVACPCFHPVKLASFVMIVCLTTSETQAEDKCRDKSESFQKGYGGGEGEGEGGSTRHARQHHSSI